MKTKALICIILWVTISAFALAFAETPETQAETIVDYLPMNIQNALADTYAGWEVVEGTTIYDDSSAALVLLRRDSKNIAVIFDNADEERCEISAENPLIVPDDATFDGRWWISDSWGLGEPFMWYTPETGEEFYYTMERAKNGRWMIASGFFETRGDSESRLAFEMANQGTALRVYGQSYFSASYVPIDVDLSFAGFSPSEMKAYLQSTIALYDQPALIPSTLAEGALAQGQVISFPKGNKYPVYAGPGKEYAQLGDTHSATVSTNDWIQVFGEQDGWLLIQYNLSPGRNRFGYITASALPKGVSVPTLDFMHKPGVVHSWVTDDPLRTVSELFQTPKGAECILLATMGEGWAYIEMPSLPVGKYRGFVPYEVVDLRENHEGKAIISVESTPLYADASQNQPIGVYFGGVELDVLDQGGAFAHVRIGDEVASQEGFIACADLAFGAVPTDVPLAPSEAMLLDDISDSAPLKGYAQPDAQAKRILLDTYPSYYILGEIAGFTQVKSTSYGAPRVLFAKSDRVVPIPGNFTGYSDIIPVVLTQDSPVYVRPDPSAPSYITLYEGLTVRCYPMGDWYLISDYEVAPTSSSLFSTFGYLPRAACRPADGDQPALRVIMLAPENNGQGRYLLAGSGEYSFGTRFMLLGETEAHQLVRTPLGSYGFFAKADLRPIEGMIAQEGYQALSYGFTTLATNTGYYERPYEASGKIMAHDAGTQVRLLGCLGSWWSIAIEGYTGYLPAEALLEAPKDVPAYEGIFDDFRDAPFAFLWQIDPPLYGNETDAWMFLWQEERFFLVHMQKQAGEWIETERTGFSLGASERVLGDVDFEMEQAPLRFTVAHYQENSNVHLTQTFEKSADEWMLSRFQMTQTQYTDDGNQETLFDHVFSSSPTGWVMENDENTQAVALDELLSLSLSAYSAEDMLTLCLALAGE